MEINYPEFYSENLSRTMPMSVYGHAGRPVLFIPCQDGHHYDFANFHMTDTFQGWIDSGTITPYFSYDLDCSKDSFFLYFQDETADVDAVYAFVKEQLDRMKEEPIDEDALSQMKRRMIGTIIRVMDNPLDMIGSWARGVLRELSIFEECGIVESLDSEFCLKMMQEISLKNKSCLKLVSDSETASF